MVEGGRVGAGCGQGHLHLQGGDQRVLGGAASSLSLPPVLTQAASQQEALPRGFIFTRKSQQGVLCRDTTEQNSVLHTHTHILLHNRLQNAYTVPLSVFELQHAAPF